MPKETEAATLITDQYKIPVVQALRDLKKQRQLFHVAKRLQINYPRLTELHAGYRPLTPFYLGILLRGGIVTIEQILQGRDMAELPEDHQAVLLKLDLDDETMKQVYRLQRQMGTQKLNELLEMLG